MKMKKLAALLIAAALPLTLAACVAGGNTAEGGKADDWAYIEGNKKMVIGYTVYEPMNYTDDSGAFTGFDTEFAQAVCAKLGVEASFVEINWDTKTVELESKNIDCIWNGMTITDELKESLDISAPYVKNAQVVVINAANAATFTDTASLKGAALMAEAGSAGEGVIQSDANLSTATYTPCVKQTDALMELKAGTSDAAVLDLTLAKAMVGQGDYSDLMMIDGLELSVEEYGIGFRKNGNTADKVNEAIKALVADGTLPALAEKYGLVLSGE